MTKIQTTEEFDWEFWNYVLDLEKEWQDSLSRFSDRELLEIFPEVKQIIPEKIKEYQKQRERLVRVIKNKLMLIRDKVGDEFSKCFFRKMLKLNEGEELVEIDTNVTRLKRISGVSKGKIRKGRIIEEQIQRALMVPIINIVDQAVRLQKVGSYYRGLCPFHQEKYPSFFVYPNTNSFWCYGCKQGGNVINFVRLLYNYSFKETVKYLIGEK